VTQITVILTTIIASLQDRVVSWLYYADRLFQLPLGMIGIAISVALLPDLSRKIRADDRVAALESENRALEAALLLTLPASVALFVAAQPIVSVLFQRGAFTATDAAATAGMLAALALGLPAFVLVRVLQPGFFAREDTKAPMLYSGIGMGANAVFSLALFLVLGPVGIALGTAFAGWLQVTLLARTLRRRGDFILDQNFRRRAPAICIASGIMGAVLWLLSGVFEAWMAPANPTLFRVTGLTALVGGGLLVYAVAAEWLGATSFRPILKSLAKRKPA
jgi:putative peptidoglycan lipid II flippase